MNWENAALLYAEKYGIIEYQVKGKKMVYKQWYYGEGTYKVVVDLKTGEEVRKLMKRDNKRGPYNGY